MTTSLLNTSKDMSGTISRLSYSMILLFRLGSNFKNPLNLRITEQGKNQTSRLPSCGYQTICRYISKQTKQNVIGNIALPAPTPVTPAAAVTTDTVLENQSDLFYHMPFFRLQFGELHLAI